MSQEPKNPVKASERTFDIIETLRDLDGARLTELADEIGLPKSTVHNHLQTLLKKEYVTKTDGTYHLALTFLDYGEYVRRNHELYRVARPVVDELAEETGEVANLMVPEHGRGGYLYKSKGEQAVHHDTRAGKQIHLHCTALGKSILAHMPSADVDRIIEEHGLPRKTEKTVTDRETLFDQLAEIRDRGYARNYGERTHRVRCVASPILNDENEVLGSMSVSGPEIRMQDSYFEDELPELLQEATNVVEINLTHDSGHSLQ